MDILGFKILWKIMDVVISILESFH